MKIRSVTDLSDVLRDDLAYRRKEIQFYETMVRTCGPANKQASLRGGIAVLYAHWEGFVKLALQAYVDFVGSQRKNVCDLADAFVAMAAKKQMNQLHQSARSQPHAEFVRWLRTRFNGRAHLPDGAIVNTQSNLTVEVFRDLIGLVGLKYDNEYAIAEKPVIERLVGLRNYVAHGEWSRLDEREWKDQLYPKISDLLEMLCSQIETAASNNEYLKP